MTQPEQIPAVKGGPRHLARRRLLAMLWKPEMTPDRILAEMNLPPGRTLRMLYSTPMRRDMESLARLAEQQQRLATHRAALTAISALTSLAAGTGETARKACMDLLAVARECRQADPAAEILDDRELEGRIERILGSLDAEPEAD